MSPKPSRLRSLLSQPFVGFAPWILLSVVEGPHRVTLAAVLACALALLLFLLGLATGMRPKLLEVSAVVFFAALALASALAGAGAQSWLGLWSSELSNLMVALIALLSIAFRSPFTLQYARESTERQYWQTPLFRRINYVITAVWAAAFLLIAVSGYIGDGPLHQPNNIWTDWVVQIALVVVAIKFTAWYPDHATARHETGHGAAPHPGATARAVLRPLSVYLVPVGILVLIFADTAWWVGVALMVLGIAGTHFLRGTPAPAAGDAR